MDKPSDAAIYERARRLANLAMWTVELQRRRLKTCEPEDGEFLFRRWTDFQFLIVSLTRLKRAAQLAARIPALKSTIEIALNDFDSLLPMLKPMRDIAEHFDDYAMDQGRDSNVSRKSLEVGVVGETIFQWLGYELNADIALAASRRLFKVIQQAQGELAR